MSDGGGARTPIRQNQDSRDYGIFRTLPARVFDRLWRKGRDWRDKILKIPRILILTKTLACAAAPISARHSNSLPASFPLSPPSFPFSTPVIPILYPVIPAKAGIQTVAAKPAIRNQARIASDKSPLPSWACRVGFEICLSSEGRSA